MGLLDSFERGLERAVNGAFAKTFRSGIQPVEIASALRSELDTNAAVVSRERILVPNTFTVYLSSGDLDRMRALGGQLVDELNGIVHDHARKQHYSFPGAVSISLAGDQKLSTGQLRVESQSAGGGGRVTWRGVLEIAGRQHPLSAARTVIGRGSDADITIPDAGTSRRHVEILWDGERAMVRDLGSTNGTKLNGRKVSEAPLPPDSTVSIGRTDIVFRVVPQTVADDATRAFPAREAPPWRDPLT
ncbi:FhaA domain-containing protein [Microbacterium sp. GXF7504]